MGTCLFPFYRIVVVSLRRDVMTPRRSEMTTIPVLASGRGTRENDGACRTAKS